VERTEKQTRKRGERNVTKPSLEMALITVYHFQGKILTD
jgi:hypothetical protein